MRKAISNTSPLLYLYRIAALPWLPQIFTHIWTPKAVSIELQVGRLKGYDVPQLTAYPWLELVQPSSVPSEWLALDLGLGELETMALALENPGHIVLLDDGLARRIAQAAGLEVWGTLRILLEAKALGLVDSIESPLRRLADSGMWISDEVRRRVLSLAGE